MDVTAGEQQSLDNRRPQRNKAGHLSGPNGLAEPADHVARARRGSDPVIRYRYFAGDGANTGHRLKFGEVTLHISRLFKTAITCNTMDVRAYDHFAAIISWGGQA
jgi:hypothetical protein